MLGSGDETTEPVTASEPVTEPETEPASESEPEPASESEPEPASESSRARARARARNQRVGGTFRRAQGQAGAATDPSPAPQAQRQVQPVEGPLIRIVLVLFVCMLSSPAWAGRCRAGRDPVSGGHGAAREGRRGRGLREARRQHGGGPVGRHRVEPSADATKSKARPPAPGRATRKPSPCSRPAVKSSAASSPPSASPR